MSLLLSRVFYRGICIGIGLIIGLIGISTGSAETVNAPLSTFVQTEDLTFKQQKQLQILTEELRCLVCQNQSLWDSNAPLAKDLRGKVAEKIRQGYTEQEIKQYLVSRYGQFILFKPAFNASTYLLWIAPFACLVLGGIIWVGLARSSRKKS